MFAKNSVYTVVGCLPIEDFKLYKFSIPLCSTAMAGLITAWPKTCVKNTEGAYVDEKKDFNLKICNKAS